MGSLKRSRGDALEFLDTDELRPDVGFELEGARTIKAHRQILGSRCEYFRKLLFGSMKEAQEETVKVPHYSHAAFLIALKDIYSEGRENFPIDVTESLVAEVLELAVLHDNETLRSTCLGMLEVGFTVENALERLQIATRHAAEALE